MALYTQFDDSTCYVVLAPPLAIDRLRDKVHTAALAPAFTWIQSVVVDARDVDFMCAPAELYEMACYMAGLDMDAERRVAIVTRSDTKAVEQAEFLQYCAMKRGAHVRAFQEYDLAAEWARDVHTISER